MGHDGRAVDPEALCEFFDRGAGVSLLEEFVDLWGSEAGLFLMRRSATLRGLGTALSIIWRGCNALTRGFRV